jgi:MFS superfamily sulfate permease-like transporter
MALGYLRTRVGRASVVSFDLVSLRVARPYMHSPSSKYSSAVPAATGGFPPVSGAHPVAPPPRLHAHIGKDLLASLVVFLVALPLCLGIALASGAPLFSGVVAGIVGGIVVGALSGSHTSVSGPAAGLTAVVLAQITALGSYEAFLLAVAIAGILQIGLGIARAGALSAFVPSSVIKGLLAAIGVILILKQIPHVLGRDTDPEGEMRFEQPDRENTFSALLEVVNLHPGAALVGLLSLALLIVWSRSRRLSDSPFPAPLAVVLLGVSLGAVLEMIGGQWAIGGVHLVQVPVVTSGGDLFDLLRFPDFSQWSNMAIYGSAVTIAIVASLETLLNLEAVDRLDPEQRKSPPNRELLAQGAGNLVSGLVGGIPITAVIIRGSVNIHAGAKSKLSTIFHGVLLLVTVVALPTMLNRIPLSCLAAILLVTGFRLVSPKLIRSMWAAGKDQFLPFAITVLAIVFTDLLVGLGIGIAVSLGFILNRQFNRPFRRIDEKHLLGDTLTIELPDQVSFLNQTAIERALESIPRGRHVVLDARRTEYIDPDALALIHEYREVRAPARGIHLTLVGFHDEYSVVDEVLTVDYSMRELQGAVTPAQVLEILRQGNLRFTSGRRLNRDYAKQIDATAGGQHPLAVVLSCIDSRTPAELILDMGLGDIFSVRVAGNGLSPKVLGSMEFGCAIAGSRLILVLGHTNCGAVKGAVERAASPDPSAYAAEYVNLRGLLNDIEKTVGLGEVGEFSEMTPDAKQTFIDDVARRNVATVVNGIVERSPALAKLVEDQRIAIVGAIYDVRTGGMEFFVDDALGLSRPSADTPMSA